MYYDSSSLYGKNSKFQTHYFINYDFTSLREKSLRSLSHFYELRLYEFIGENYYYHLKRQFINLFIINKLRLFEFMAEAKMSKVITS